MRTMYSCRYAAKKFTHKLFVFFIILSILSVIFVWIVSMRDLIDELVVNELEYLVTDIINTSVYDSVKKSGYTFNDLTIINRDGNGSINSVSIEPSAANLMKSDIAALINERVNKISDDDVHITVGMIIGYCNLGSWGPEIPLAVLPNTNVEIDFSNEFASCGINQVQDNLTINVNVHVSALMPFLKCTSTIHSSVIVAQTVIVGDVPNTYLEIEDWRNDR